LKQNWITGPKEAKKKKLKPLQKQPLSEESIIHKIEAPVKTEEIIES